MASAGAVVFERDGMAADAKRPRAFPLAANRVVDDWEAVAVAARAVQVVADRDRQRVREVGRTTRVVETATAANEAAGAGEADAAATNEAAGTKAAGR